MQLYCLHFTDKSLWVISLLQPGSQAALRLVLIVYFHFLFILRITSFVAASTRYDSTIFCNALL